MAVVCVSPRLVTRQKMLTRRWLWVVWLLVRQEVHEMLGSIAYDAGLEETLGDIFPLQIFLGRRVVRFRPLSEARLKDLQAAGTAVGTQRWPTCAKNSPALTRVRCLAQQLDVAEAHAAHEDPYRSGGQVADERIVFDSCEDGRAAMVGFALNRGPRPVGAAWTSCVQVRVLKGLVVWACAGAGAHHLRQGVVPDGVLVRGRRRHRPRHSDVSEPVSLLPFSCSSSSYQ